MVSWPFEVAWLYTYSMSSTPLISCSIGVATVSDTVCAEAPGYCVVTTTVRRRHLRIFRHRQGRIGDRSNDHEHDGQHHREDGAVDGEAAEVHGLAAAGAGAAAIFGATLAPTRGALQAIDDDAVIGLQGPSLMTRNRRPADRA